MRKTQPRREGDRPPGAAHCFVQLSELPQGIAQVAVRFRIVGFECECGTVASDRIRVCAQLLERVPQIVLWLG